MSVPLDRRPLLLVRRGPALRFGVATAAAAAACCRPHTVAAAHPCWRRCRSRGWVLGRAGCARVQQRRQGLAEHLPHLVHVVRPQANVSPNLRGVAGKHPAVREVAVIITSRWCARHMARGCAAHTLRIAVTCCKKSLISPSASGIIAWIARAIWCSSPAVGLQRPAASRPFGASRVACR